MDLSYLLSIKVQITDSAAMKAIPVVCLQDYLREHGWEHVPGKFPWDKFDAAWIKDPDGIGDFIDVLAPPEACSDYGRCVASTIQTLAQIENRSELAIYHEIMQRSEHPLK